MLHFLTSRAGEHRHRDTFLNKRVIAQDHTKNSVGNLPSRWPQIDTLSDNESVSRLPAETLAEIFKYTQLVSYDSKEREFNDVDWCWLTITHVCKHWRDIAVGMHELWTLVDTEKHASAEQTAVYLERSGVSPLVVIHRRCSILRRDNEYLPSLHLALRQIHRIRELHIQVSQNLPQTDHNGVWFTLSQNPAPVLQIFTLEFMRENMFDIRELFMGHAPQLRRMSLLIDSPSYVTPVVRNLTYLHISTASLSLTLEDVFSILKENPNLENFTISSPYEIGGPHLIGSYTIPAPIRLSCLKDLIVEHASYGQLCHFLQHIDLPDSIDWAISCIDYPIRHQQDANPKNIFPCICNSGKCATLEIALSSKLARIYANPRNIPEYCDDENDSRQFITYSWSRDEEEEDDDDDDDFREPVKAVECMSFVRSVIKDVFWCFTTVLTVQIVQSFDEDLSVTDRLGYLPWIQLLKMLPKLENLTVRRTAFIDSDTAEDAHLGILKALSGMYKDEDGEIPLICPNLSVLRLYGMEFQIGLVNLVECLAYRASKWKQLSKLILSYPSKEEYSDVIIQSLKESNVFGSIEINDDYY